MADEKIKNVIIDTDNGDDIDDLFTIYCLLGQKNINIVGIVCSYLNTPLRARQVKHVLRLAHREDVPVYVGVGKSIRGYHDRPTDLQYWQYEDILMKDEYKPNSEDAEGEEAIQFLIDSARKYKDTLYICEIAPQCTLGTAILRDKEAFKGVHVYIMGGSFFNYYSEWNIECDIDAARAVFESGLDLYYVGLDVTRKTFIPDDMYERFCNVNKDDYINYLISTTKLWRSFSKRNPTLHDPLTFLTIFYDVCEFEEVEGTLLEQFNGFNSCFVRKDDPSSPKDGKYFKAKVARTIDEEKAFKLIFGIIGIENSVIK